MFDDDDASDETKLSPHIPYCLAVWLFELSGGQACETYQRVSARCMG